ncbi:MAG: cytochrome c1 [Gammaproteobacteria bacterium]|nr:cytochrome c1 [Gammaproteobacteria bacterium]
MKATRFVAGLLATATALVLASQVHAAGDVGHIEQANNELENSASLQRGARNFMNYCVGCHALKYVRYNRLSEDLGLNEDQLKENLIFGADKANANVNRAMTSEQATKWFNAEPPDLSLTARSRGVDWIYTYLKTFYVDESRDSGVNNLLLAGSSMPHVLWELQGLQRAVYRNETVVADGGFTEEISVFDYFEPLKAGTLTPAEYDGFVRDTVNFLDYVGEPMKLKRQRIGLMVLGYLVALGLLLFALKKEYWRDIH